MMNVHASCVVKDGAGVLLRGPSASGKSDLAIRLIDRGFSLVSDDQVVLHEKNGVVWAEAPSTIAGLIEVRGLGLRRLRHRQKAKIILVVDLVAPSQIERLPEAAQAELCGVILTRIALAPFEGSAPIKLEWALEDALSAQAGVSGQGEG